MAEEVIGLYAVTQGYMDISCVDRSFAYEHEMLTYIKAHYEGILAQISSTGKLTDEVKETLNDALTDHNKVFIPTPEDAL